MEALPDCRAPADLWGFAADGVFQAEGSRLEKQGSDAGLKGQGYFRRSLSLC